jgi:hypothetical protein
VLINRRTIGPSQPSHFETNSVIELRRLLRSVHVDTTGREPRAELVKMVHFHLDCDDTLFDKSRMPKKLQVVQIAQACILVPFGAPESRGINLLKEFGITPGLIGAGAD